MEETVERRWYCPQCHGPGTLQRVPPGFMPGRAVLHCEACDLYLEYYGPCPACGTELLLSDQDVDDALDGKPLLCPKCQQPLDTRSFNPGEAVMGMSGTLVPDLVPQRGPLDDSNFIDAARTLLKEDPRNRALLAIYHASTTLRIRAALRHVQSIRDLGTPFGMAQYNYDPSTERITSDADDREFDFEMRVFDFLMNARSALDTLAHEVNLVYRYVGTSRGHSTFFDFTNSEDERKVDLFRVTQKLVEICPDDALTTFLKRGVEDPWFTYLTALRDVNYHRRILIGPREGIYPLKQLWSLRPTAVYPSNVRLFLPDEPRLLWMESTYDRRRELLATFMEINGWLCGFIDQVYEFLALKLR